MDPAQLGQGLTLGTVTIATRVVAHDLSATPVALCQVAPQGGGAACLNGLHHPEMLTREAMCSAIGVAVGAEDIGDFGSGSWGVLPNPSNRCIRRIQHGQEGLGLALILG